MSRIADPKTKSALINAAERVFSERGVEGAKVEDIAKMAGVSKGAFYLHFESKEAALKEIVDGWLERCARRFAPPAEYPDAADDPDCMLDFSFEREVQLFEFFWASRSTMIVVRSCQAELEAFKAEVQRRNREWMEQWRRDGLFRQDTNVAIAAFLMSGAYEELTRQLVSSVHRPPFEEWLEFAQSTFVRAFGTPELIAAHERRSRRVTTGVLRRPPEHSTSNRRTPENSGEFSRDLLIACLTATKSNP